MALQPTFRTTFRWFVGGRYKVGKNSLKQSYWRTSTNFRRIIYCCRANWGAVKFAPLCGSSEDPNDLSVLTPGHFLTLEPLTAVPDPDLGHLHLNQLNRWQLLQRMHQDFWKRWHVEYLHTLQQRNKWTSCNHPLEIGKLVLIKDDLAPPLPWRLGRVVELHPGADDIVRVASVKSVKGVFRRPLTKLCLLPSQWWF